MSLVLNITLYIFIRYSLVFLLNEVRLGIPEFEPKNEPKKRKGRPVKKKILPSKTKSQEGASSRALEGRGSPAHNGVNEDNEER